MDRPVSVECHQNIARRSWKGHSRATEDHVLRYFAAETSAQKVLDIWLTIVSEYCSLRLTINADRLPALSGLASRIALRLKSEYLAGFWNQDLARQLCWFKERSSVSSFGMMIMEIRRGPRLLSSQGCSFYMS